MRVKATEVACERPSLGQAITEENGVTTRTRKAIVDSREVALAVLRIVYDRDCREVFVFGGALYGVQLERGHHQRISEKLASSHKIEFWEDDRRVKVGWP